MSSIKYKEYTVSATRPKDPNTTWEVLELETIHSTRESALKFIDELERIQKDFEFKHQLQKITDD